MKHFLKGWLQSAPKERRRRRAEKRLSKRVCWRVRFFSAPLRFALKTSENLEGAEKKRTIQKHPFGQPFLRTTTSPLLWRAPIAARRIETKVREKLSIKLLQIPSGMEHNVDTSREYGGPGHI